MTEQRDPIELRSFVGPEFEALFRNERKADVRLDDKKYQIGDILIHKEGFPSLEGYQFTGRIAIRRVTYISKFGMQQGFVNLSLEIV